MEIHDYRSDKGFELACKRLAETIEGSAKSYDLYVGVATGGKFVAEKVHDNISASAPLMIVKRQRPGTGAKKKFGSLKKIISILPTFIQDALRVVESRIAEHRFENNRHLPRKKNTVEILTPAVRLPQDGVRSILIIDDAVDSGATLEDVKNHVANMFPGSQIHTAALTVTHRNPLIRPDYVLHQHAIVKCPWALDGRKA